MTDDEEKDVRISVILKESQRRRLKAKAVEQGTTISEIVRDAIAKFLQE